MSFAGLFWFYVALTVAVAVPPFLWNVATLRDTGAEHALAMARDTRLVESSPARGITAPDPLIALGVAAGLLVFPMLFISGGWWSQRIVTRGHPSPARRWMALLLYSVAALAFWLILYMVGRAFERGSSDSWVVSVSTVLGYSSYLVPLAALTAVVSFIGAILGRLKHGQGEAALAQRQEARVP
jgi:hypothetical protein